MSDYRDSALRTLDDCDCCESLQVQVPQRVTNRPGLREIAYRIGTHSQFKQSLLTRLSSLPYPVLKQLTTRENDDVATALLDAWSTVADVLTFYQERIAQEAYLGTATERQSLVHLARLIGYQPRPGVAASTHLAFTLEDTPRSPQQVSIEVGTKVQSLPGPGEEAQFFETVETIAARPQWNQLQPLLTQSPRFEIGTFAVYLQGTSTQLKPGDALLFVGLERLNNRGSERWDFRKVKRIQAHPEANYTYLELDAGLGSRSPRVEPASQPQVYALRLRAALFGYNAPDPRILPTEVTDKFSDELPDSTNDWNFPLTAAAVDLDTVYPNLVPDSWAVLAKPSYTELYRIAAVKESARKNYTLSGKTTRLSLDGENIALFDQDDLRSTVVFAQSEELAIAPPPYTRPLPLTAAVQIDITAGTLTPITGDRIELAQHVPDLNQGRTLMLYGKPARVQVVAPLQMTIERESPVEVPRGTQLQVLSPATVLNANQIRWHLQSDDGKTGDVTASSTDLKFVAARAGDSPIAEPVTLKQVSGKPSQIELEQPLRHWYDRATALLYGNVAFATHGETKTEVLGSGDAAQAFQSFTLRNHPVTHVSAPTATGAASTLEVRINDMRWQPVPTLYGQGSTRRVYATHRNETGETVIQFGDGHELGARLPSGIENIRASYRQGLGTAGNVTAGQLNLLLKRPLGVKSCSNPAAPTGGADPPGQNDLRQDVPTTVLTLGRVVSRQDFEDFARTFAGIAKALATEVRGAGRAIAITVAGPEGQLVPPDSAVYQSLLQALSRNGDPFVTVRLLSYRPVYFYLAATVQVKADYLPDVVLGQVRQALKKRFSFAARSLGQGVALSNIMALIQGVEGVVAVDIDHLHRSDQAQSRQTLLRASLPRADSILASLTAAELLLLNPDSLADVEVQP